MNRTLLAAPGRARHWRYRYANRLRAPVDLWVSLPQARPGQHDMRLTFASGVPDAGWRMAVEGAVPVDVLALAPAAADPEAGTVNLLARYTVAPGREVRIEAEYASAALRLATPAEARGLEGCGWRAVPPVRPLSAAERAYWLRSSVLVSTGPEVAAEAAALAAGAAPAGGEVEVVERLYAHLVSSGYRYLWPPPDRGSEAMRVTRRGDCGQYSFLLAAWCRSLGIPARVVMGSWATGRMQAHAWNEFFCEGVGWVPLDASTAALLAAGGDVGTLVEIPAGAPRRPRPEWFLGGVDGRRMVFSVDADPHGLPGYPRAETVAALEAGEPGRLAGRSFRWGCELLDGCVPYLQPAYPRLPELPRSAGDETWLGDWRFRAPAGRAVAEGVAAVSLVAGLAAFALGATEAALSAFLALAGVRLAQGHAHGGNLALCAALAAGLLLRLLG